MFPGWANDLFKYPDKHTSLASYLTKELQFLNQRWQSDEKIILP